MGKTQESQADMKIFCPDALAQQLCTNPDCAARTRPYSVPLTLVVPSTTGRQSEKALKHPDQTHLSF